MNLRRRDNATNTVALPIVVVKVFLPLMLSSVLHIVALLPALIIVE